MKEEFCKIFHNNSRTKQRKTQIYKISGKNNPLANQRVAWTVLQPISVLSTDACKGDLTWNTINASKKKDAALRCFSWEISDRCAQYNSKRFLWKNYMDCKLKLRRSPTIRNYIGQCQWWQNDSSFWIVLIAVLWFKYCQWNAQLKQLHFRASEVSTFSLGPLLRLKTCKGAEAPPSPPLASKWPLKKAHHPLLERFLGRQRSNNSARELLLLESIWWYYSSFC